ncbi:hypothetical protein HH310_23605 [Actinoplanes sp. TBRC 11911]|uniref:chemotaxis protein CheW n=1 Tax=Actinoplanes sp. TBRC 11911 TaxID=2729386 RepID=UPI00145EC8F1|nr:chemotaxis protein CheW [Actinoplanes sp. TBRC 11911]NMO54157.1 hypothetical protein [Actinoplanes sp. TBRC 11911]
MASETADDDHVTFDMAGQRYAFPMSRVREIVRMPALVRVPLGPPALEGLANLRGRMLPVVSLRRCCAMPDAEHDDATRVIMVDGGVPLGFVVDRVSGVLSMATVEPAEDPLIGVIRTDHDVIPVLDVDRLVGAEFNRPAAQHVTAGQPAQTPERGDDGAAATRDEVVERPAETDDEDVYVVFRLDGQEYAVDVDAVQEIIRVPGTLIGVPRSLDFVEGLVNLRGAVLPVVDLRTRLGLRRRERDERQRIVVLIIDGVRTGFVVDSVAEVARVGRQVPEPAPRLSADQARVVSKVANLPGHRRLLLMIQLDQLLPAGHAEAWEDALAGV